MEFRIKTEAEVYRLEASVQEIGKDLLVAIWGGEKPHILLTGHTHKQGYFFERNIHVVSGGALSVQSNWMRRTRKANHTGFWIIKAWIGKNTVKKFQPTWYPFYA